MLKFLSLLAIFSGMAACTGANIGGGGVFSSFDTGGVADIAPVDAADTQATTSPDAADAFDAGKVVDAILDVISPIDT